MEDAVFELFSQRARQVIFLARLKAGQRGAQTIEIEDLLAGYIIEDRGEFEKAISDLFPNGNPVKQVGARSHRSFLSPDLASDLLASLQALCTQSHPVPNQSDLPLSNGANGILRLANSLREELKQTSVEPLHFLAAILEDESSRGAQIFREAGITREKVIQFLREST